MPADDRPTVLQVQTDSGLSGGIAGYVSSLVRAAELGTFRFVTVVPGLASDPVRARELYADALPVVLPPAYGWRTFAAYARGLEQAVRMHGVALMHAHALRSALACAWVSRRTGVPLVYTNHGLRYTQKAPGLARAVFRLMEAWVCRVAHAVVAIRPFDAARLQAAGLVPPERLHTLVTRIDAPTPAMAATPGGPARERPPVVLGIGSLIDVKRPDRFIEWVGALQDSGCRVQARWIGDGPLRAPMQARAAERGVAIEWCGHLSREAVAAELSRASLLALTSSFEVFPLAVLEAYAHGVPVVSGRFDGVEDFLEDGGTGVLVAADEPVQVAAAMRGVLDDAPRWQALSARAREVFHERFEGAGRLAAGYASLYRSVLP